jgi:hypothetical protein
MTTKKSKSTDVAKTEKKSTALAPTIDYGTDTGAGLGDVGRDEAGIPFLKILQAQSPEVIGPSGKIAGAAAGIFLNTGTEELLESITIVPAMRQHVFVEWRPRKQGGGIVKVHQPNDEIVQAAIAASTKFGKYKTEAGNDLVETFYVFAVVMEDDAPTGFVVVPFSSTGIKHYKKKFINRIRYCLVDDGQGAKRNPPMFAHRVTLTTAQESNDDGTWSNYAIKFAIDNNVQQSLMAPDHAGYISGKELKALFDSGAVKADLDKAATTDGGEETDDSAF